MEEIIEFIPKKDKLSKGIKEASGEIKELKQEASNIELAPTNEKVRKASKEALENKKSQNVEQKRAIEITRELNKLMLKASGSDEKKALQLKAWRREVSDLEAEYSKLSASGEDTKKISQELSKAYKNLNIALKDSKIGGLQKLLNTFKRVGFYRLARRLFQVIEQGLSQGLEKLIAFDSQTNKTASSISSSFDKITGSIALIVSPLLEVIEPVLSLIANGIAEVANAFSMASAKMKGLSTYTKINTEYMKDLQSEAKSTLLSFDKFESLNAEETPYEESLIPDDIDDSLTSLEGVFNFLNSIKDLLLQIWEIAEGLIGFALKDMDSISYSLDFISELINNIRYMIGFLGDLIKGDFSGAWNHLKNLAISCLNVMLKAVNAVWNSLIRMAQLTLDIFVNPIIGLFGGEKIKIPTEKIQVPSIPYYKNGGIVDGGSLFVAGEGGYAEIVSKYNSGQTGVTNVSQFKQAMVEAIYECADVFQQSDGSVVLNLDGAQIARSKNFKNELNRTNAGLNLR